MDQQVRPETWESTESRFLLGDNKKVGLASAGRQVRHSHDVLDLLIERIPAGGLLTSFQQAAPTQPQKHQSPNVHHC